MTIRQPFRPGTIIATRHWWGEHWMVVAVHAGRYTVISNSARRDGVAEEWLDEVLADNSWRVVGYLGQLSPAQVVARARSRIGQPYQLLSWNCEDFAHWAHGLEACSPQRAGLAAILSITAFGLLAARAAR